MKEINKKVYSAPKAEKIDFDYNNQVVASDGGPCYYRNIGTADCSKDHEVILENS